MQEQNKTQERLGVSISPKWGKIRIFRSVIVALNEPKYIRFLFNPEKKKLAIQACKSKVAESFRVPKYVPDAWDFKINSVQMIKMISSVCGWKSESTYRIVGNFHEVYNLVEYDLDKAVMLAEEEF